ncbi:hypothetical protein [uncultured Acinetobacter sp.]|uniref:hypothetical protein n=1 Tax=uncultured Acinetobacter sp. TaxID=165433 RepID=UPI00258792A4|nr:hypothetical protein [uncultured Acinetobacter sp.]
MISQGKFSSQAEHKQTQSIQSFYDPALHTLEKLLDVRKANLRKRNDDESKAAVTRNEFMQALNEEHRISIWYAGEVVSSLKRAGKINCFGSFINLPEVKGDDAK